MMHGGDAFVDKVIGAADASNGIVNSLWAVKRNDDVVKEVGNLPSTFMEEKAGSQESEVNILFAKKVAESRKIIMQQRFTTCENDLADTKVFEREAMTLQILRSKLIIVFTLPDIAHDTAAVTPAVYVQDENR